jgi:hypothetical protein
MKSRLFVEARGGIGNQLFAYAAAKHFSHRFKLPVSIFLRDKHHVNSSIHRLKLGDEQIDIFTRQKMSISAVILFLIRILKKTKVKTGVVSFYDFNNMSTLQKQEIDKLKLASNRKDFFYFIGYFADMKYVNTSSISELNLKLDIFAETDGKLDLKFLELNSISLHIRAGDYLLDPDHYGVLGKDYYRNAIAYIKERFPELQVRVWSDDYVFAKSLLIDLCFEYDILFMDTTELKDPILSLYCMSKSGYHILSLSTFSYWSAILSKEAAVVIYPAHNRKLIPYVDHVPISWIPIEPAWYTHERD